MDLYVQYSNILEERKSINPVRDHLIPSILSG